MFLGWSSCVYPLEADDFASVPDYVGEAISAQDLPDDPVLLLIQKDGPDCLLRGREVIVGAGGGTVPVRVVFKPSIAKWNLPVTYVRVLRNKYRYHGTGVYHIAAQTVRAMGLERCIRTLDHPQQRKNRDRAASMRRLAESLKTRGYDDAHPINVMVCRVGGRIDFLHQGHHRVSACLECGVSRMAVTFSAAGAVFWKRAKRGASSTGHQPRGGNNGRRCERVVP